MNSILILMIATGTLAYAGPGAGLTLIGTIIAFLGAIILMIFGLFWYPIKRLIAKRKGIDSEITEEPTSQPYEMDSENESTQERAK